MQFVRPYVGSPAQPQPYDVEVKVISSYYSQINGQQTNEADQRQRHLAAFRQVRADARPRQLRPAGGTNDSTSNNAFRFSIKGVQRRTKTRLERGMALAVTMLVLFGIMTVLLLGSLGQRRGNGGSGIMTVTGNAMQMSQARLQSVAAFNMAESGVEYTLQWLNGQPAPPNLSAAYAPPSVGRLSAAAPARAVVVPDPNYPGNQFSVVIYPDAGNSGNQQKKYLIESVGTSGGFTQIVQAYVEVTSLSKWLVLVDKWPANN